MFRKLVSCADFKAILTPFSRLRKETRSEWGCSTAPVTSSGLGKESGNFWRVRKRKRLLAVYRLLKSFLIRTVTPPSILNLEGGVTVSNNFTKRRQNGFKIGTRDKFATHLRKKNFFHFVSNDKLFPRLYNSLYTQSCRIHRVC